MFILTRDFNGIKTLKSKTTVSGYQSRGLCHGHDRLRVRDIADDESDLRVEAFDAGGDGSSLQNGFQLGLVTA